MWALTESQSLLKRFPLIKRRKVRSLAEFPHKQRIGSRHRRGTQLGRLRWGVTVGLLTGFGLTMSCQLVWRHELLVVKAAAWSTPTPFPTQANRPSTSGSLTNRPPTLTTAVREALLAQSESAPESAPESATDAPAAPSRVWLIVMPAVPIVGGFLICLSRRLLGKAHGESRLITHMTTPEASSPEDSNSSSAP